MVFLPREFSRRTLDVMLGFAAGVMIAASFWSLLAPALDMARPAWGRLAFIPAAVGFLAGAAGLFFGDLIQMTAGTSLCLLLLGLFCFVYDGMIAPLLDGGAAAKEYDGKEELRMATTFVFEGDRVKVDNGRVKGNLPLSLVTRWDVLAGQFSFAFGRELSFVIPARLLDESQTAELKNRMETVSRETPESRNTGGKAAV